MDVTLFRTCSHVIIMMLKVDPVTEVRARILIKEKSFKAIEIVLGKAQLMQGFLNFSLADQTNFS